MDRVTLTSRIVALHHEGKSGAEIARICGVTQARVWDDLRAAGIARPAHRTKASMAGDNLADPKRADRALRSFGDA